MNDSDNYPFMVVFGIAVLMVGGIALSNWLPKANAAFKFPTVCQMGTHAQEIITVPTAQVEECLTELGNVKHSDGTLVQPISAKLIGLPIGTLQSIYSRITGVQDVSNDPAKIAGDIMTAAFKAPHGANIPEIGIDISGTWPNLTVTPPQGDPPGLGSIPASE